MRKKDSWRCLLAAANSPAIRVSGAFVTAGAAWLLAWRATHEHFGPAVDTRKQQSNQQDFTAAPSSEVEEIMPAAGGRSLDARAAYASDSEDAPGWRVHRNQPAAVGTAAAPWRTPDTVKWRIRLEGEGHASPIVVGDSVYFTTADNGPSLWLASHDFESGVCRWRRSISRQAFPPRHEKTSDAASTPCSDGDRLFVARATSGLVHLDAIACDGTHLWTTALGPFSARWGFTASPAWAHGIVVVGADNSAAGFLAAVDAVDGSILWRRRRRHAGDESYSSPMVGGHAGDEIVMAGLDGVDAFSLHDGSMLWHAGGISSTAGMTPVLVDDICVASSGFPARRLVALRMGGGDRTEVETLWREDRDSEVPYVPTPVASSGRLHVVHDDGVAHCRDLVSGTIFWKRRIGGSFSASPILVRGEILCASESGRCVLIDTETGDIAHEFTLPAGCFATPVVVRDTLLIRTTEELLCFDLASESHTDVK